MKCKTCGKLIPYSKYKLQCYTCWKADQMPKKEIIVDQDSCPHEETDESHRPTSSGAMLIHEIICRRCKKVLSHRAEDIPYEMQSVFRH